MNRTQSSTPLVSTIAFCLIIISLGGSRLFAQQPSAKSSIAFNVQTGSKAIQSGFREDLLTLDINTLSKNYLFLSQLKAIQPLHPSAAKLSPEIPVAQWFTLTFQVNSTSDSLLIAEALIASDLLAQVEANRLRPLHAAKQSQLVPNDPKVSDQWYHAKIQTFSAWNTTQSDSSIVVGVLDTGLDFGHPEFVGQLAFNKLEDKPPYGIFDDNDLDGVDDDGNGFIDDVIGYDFADQPRLLGGGDYLDPDPVPFDDNQHGTLVAGILAAKANNNEGGTGIAPNCKIMVLRAFTGTGVGEDDDVARAIIYAADNGAKVLNYSFGDIYPSNMMHAAIQYAHQKGIIQVASAGNGTGSNLHYPSGFQEVISVSASDFNPASGREFLWPISSFGQTVDLCAPGSGIVCPIPRDTTGNPRYGSFSGTSCSAPMVSAAAALLLSVRDSVTPQGFKSLVCASADDLSPTGWDFFTGAGRLNISNLLALYGNGQVEILNPRNDGGSADPQIAVVGTALHPLFVSWQLSYQMGTQNGPNWIPLTPVRTNQVLADTLAIWPLAGLDDTVYTLRLSVLLRNGQTQEHRVRFVRDTGPPSIQFILAAGIWEDNLRKPYFVFRANDVCSHELHLKAPGDTTHRVYTADKKTHIAEFIIEPQDLPASLQAGGIIAYRFHSTNASGLSITTGYLSDLVYFPDAIGTTGVTKLGFSLPYGDALSESYDFDNDGYREVLMSRFDSLFSYGPIQIYEWEQGKFNLVDAISTPKILLPKAVADVDNDGKPELICNFTDSVYVFEAQATSYPTGLDWSDFSSKIFPSTWADYRNDGSIGLIAKDFERFYAFDVTNRSLTRRFNIESQNANYAGSDTRTLVDDFDGDGLQEVVTGDFDGRIHIYEFMDDATGFIRTYSLETKQIETADYLQKGDFDGDGQPEIFVASRTNLLRNSDYEYDARYWTLRILKAVSNNTYETVWEDFIYNVNSQFFNASLAANLDADNRDEILIHTFPRTYLLEYENGGYQFTWFAFGTNAVGGVAGDFNGNGINEFAIGVGDSLLFFERQTNYAGPLPVRLLQGKPTGPATSKLWWLSSSNATSYEVWRGILVGGNASLTRQATVTDTVYVDQLLTPGTRYVYQIRPVRTGATPPTGPFSNAVIIRPNNQAQLMSITVLKDNQLALQFSQPVTDRQGDAGLFWIDDLTRNRLNISLVQNILPLEPNGLVVSLKENLAVGNYVLRIDTAFTDRNNLVISPIIDDRSRNFTINGDTTARIHLLSFSANDEKTARLTFSTALTNSALVPSNYQVLPNGQVQSLRFADTSGGGLDSSTVIVGLTNAVLGPTGIPISIIVKNLRGLRGEIQRPDGDAATFWTPASDLSDAYVYPNPVVIGGTDFGCRFAGVPNGSSITLMTAAGHLTRTLIATETDGGVTWDLTTYEGKTIAPGIYLYRIETTDGQSVRGSFAVVK